MDFLQFGPSISPVPLPPFPSLQIILFHAVLLSTTLCHIPLSSYQCLLFFHFLTACTRKAAVGFISGIKAEC